MVSRVLAQVVENLCILHDGAGSLSQIQKFIELSLNESFGYVVRSKGGLELVPGDDMIGRLHGVEMIPP
jgi:G3E family GTPase